MEWTDDPDGGVWRGYIGSTHTFPDGSTLQIVGIKRRDDGPWITYAARHGGGLPRRGVMPLPEFIELWGHLFAA